MAQIFLGIHIASLIGLAAYGLLGFLTLWLFLRHRTDDSASPQFSPDQLPSVTVQLPVYNERGVVERLIATIAKLEYPADRLEIQVLDDSTDDTTRIAAEMIEQYSTAGKNIRLIHRTSRRGFKAGALEEALHTAGGEFIAVFDADFVPDADFLIRTIPYLLADPGIGAVQARWGHLNSDESALTGAQAVALDKHFAIEQLVRHRADLFPKFNGSAGVWRRACIVDSGGWHYDTACEDLCLSTRAVLRGWRFQFANDVVAQAELPPTILSYKAQQARWAMGATQCLIKYFSPICRASGKTHLARAYSLLSMSAYLTHALFLILLLVQLPLILMDVRMPAWLYLFTFVGLGQPILFILAQGTLYEDWLSRLRHFPTLLLIAIGIAPANTIAVIKGSLLHDFTFRRTPKGTSRSYRLTPDWTLIVEMGFMVYSGLTLALALLMGSTGSIFLLASAVLGFSLVVGQSMKEYFLNK